MTLPEVREPLFDQQKHPELRKDEMWFTNLNQEEREMMRIGYRSKRFGNIAYDIFGNEVEGLVPVFVSREEYEQKMEKYE